MATAPPRLPIVYIRGYAGATAGIEEQVEDPLYGFNKGTVHVRVAGDGDPMFYQFEGPLLRLIDEHGYRLLVRGSQEQLLLDDSPEKLPWQTIWIHRFYDSAAPTLTAPAPKHPLLYKFGHVFSDHLTADHFNLEDAARSLYALIDRVLVRTGAPKVVLVAHSMGGLVARCMMQKICEQQDEQTKAPRRRAKEIVSALFTYGTPHGGIAMDPGLVNRMMEQFGPAGSDVFSPPKMYGYLTPTAHFGDEPPEGADWDPQTIPTDVFDPNDVFCVIGTDPSDYGLSRIPVGPRSDGLVRIEHAYVRNAHRAFVYKSHSGTYGEVNSEEGYQNLQRFLFGRWAVSVGFTGLPVADPPGPEDNWQADMRLSIRGLSVVISEQRAAHWCPIDLNGELQARGDDPDHPIPLMSTSLLERTDGASRYVLSLSVFRLRVTDHGFDFANHVEGVGDWDDALVVDVGPVDGRLTAWVGWRSELPDAVSSSTQMTRQLDFQPARGLPDGTLAATVDLPATARTLPIFGEQPKLQVTVRDRWAEQQA